MNNFREILVYADWEGTKTPQLIGTLFSSYLRGKEIFSFEYDKLWLHSSFSCEIDPDLGLYAGIQYLRDEKSNFGVFLDSSPDRWGRLLMDRRESILARIEKQTYRPLNESDYLLGVFDEQRMGALRFKESQLAEFIIRKGANVDADLAELFRRIVFSICISNTDDHLRNHGFLLTQGGWTLSPAYDINPNPKGLGLKLNITTHDNALDLDLAVEVASFFRLTEIQAGEIIRNTIDVVSKWKKTAKKYKISNEEVERMSPAFRIKFR